MKRSVLIVMIDVMVLSVLSLNIGRGASSSFLLPVYQWNTLIQKGLEREKEYRQELQDLKIRAEQAEKKAMEAGELLDRHKVLSDSAARQASDLAQRESEAYRKMQKAAEEARAAELQAQVALEQKKLAEQVRAQAEVEKKEALLKAEQAEKAAAEAAITARTAREREQEVLQRIAGMQQESATLLDQQIQTSKLLQDTRHERDMTHAEMQRLLEAKEELTAREKTALEQADAERKKAAELLVQVRLAEAQAKDAESRAESSQTYINALRERIVSTKLAEQEVTMRLQQAEQQSAELKAKMESIEAEKNQSVWIQRDQALTVCSVSLGALSRHTGERTLFQEDLYLPVTLIGGQPCLVADFDQLGLSQWHVQYGDNMNAVEYTVSSPSTNAARIRLTHPILADPQAPRVCYLPVSVSNGALPGLTLCGMARLKQERIQEALAFSPANPDTSVRVLLTPALDERFLTVKPVQTKGLFSRRELRQGDYLLTETGFFIGLMITHDKAYVVPDAPLRTDEPAFKVPLLNADPTNTYFTTFSGQAQSLRKTVKAFNP